MIRILPFGGYRNRQPLAYEPIRATLGDRIALVNDPDDAQILLISHAADLDLFGDRIGAMLAPRPRLRLVLLSEEPFWDSCFMPDPFGRHQNVRVETGSGMATVACSVLNHETTAIFRAARIPYFLLTDPAYIARYRPLFDRNAGLSAQDWQRHFRTAPLDAVFLAERRTNPRLAPVHHGGRLRGLSVWRSRVAEACAGPRVVVEGKGWGGGPPRQELPDWHADKLARFDMQTRYMAAFENTYQADYVSEKIWDAFAVGAVPLYAAGPGHTLLRLIGSGGWINFFGQLDTIPAFDPGQPPDPALAGEYVARQEDLARLFADPGIVAAERERLAEALLAELRRLLDAPMPAAGG